MAAPLLPQLAFVILEELVEKKRDVGALLPEVVKFAMPVAFDPYLDESGRRWIFETSDYADYARMFGDAKQEHSLFQQAEDLLRDLRNVTPEEAILSCEDTSLEELVDHARWGAYVTRKRELRQKFRNLGLNAYDVAMLVFVLLLHIRETGDKDLSDLATKIRNDSTDERLKGIAKNRTPNAQFWNSCAAVISDELPKPEGDSYPILSMLRNAHSTKRCMGESRASLFSYLRCCQYSGAPFLQSQTAIYLTAKSVVRDYAVPDNIRYLCLRCNIIGYTSFGLQNKEDVIRDLLDAFKFYGQDPDGSEFRSNGTTVLVNLIVSANRAKTETAVEQNVNLVMEYLKKSEPAPCSPRVVSFDLMGLEKGNRPEKFLKVMTPLLKECFPITVHAGEEDEADSIWQAVYLIQSQRIGHGLSLRNNEKLMTLVRERHVSVELCPLSNLLTNGKFKAPGSSGQLDHRSPECYPLRQYLDDNLDVTINTDNPMISSATLSQEYIVAAKYSGGLTKWEVLRLIKNAFRSAAIPKQEKRELMNKIDDEIFEILLNEA
jgi:adenosine deaminase